MSPANILLGITMILAALSFIAFFRLMAREPDQRALVTGSKPGKLINFLVIVPLICILAFGPETARLIAAVAIFPAMLFLSSLQRRWLLTRGASRTFLNSLMVSSVGFGLSVAAFAGAMILGA